MFNPKVFANSRPDGISALEITGETERRTDQPRLFVPLKRTELSGEVTGPLASLRLTQIYGYSKEQCDKALEAVYRFPLPGDAAVTRVRVSFGEVEINAELKERGQAETEYEEARREGRQAALATRESPDVFTLRVAGIQPDQEIRVETSYTQLARAEGAGWSLRIPLTTAPRYVRDDEAASRHAQGQPLALLRDPGHRFALDLVARGAATVESGTHQLTTSEEDGGVRARLRDGEIIPDRDCVLTWRPRQEASAAALQVFLSDDPESGQAYFLALVSPPSARDVARSAPREAILLVDHSGSMEGAKWAAADWAVKSFLYGLSERDTFALGLFHDSTRWFDKKPRQADGATKFLTSDPEEEDISTALDEALAEWGEPVLTGLRLEVNSPVAQAAGRETRATRESGQSGQSDWTGIDLGDLPAGRAVWVIGRAPRSRLADFSFRLTRRGLDPVADCRIELHRTDKDHAAIKALFGARRVLGLEYLIHSNYSSDELRDRLARLGYDPGQVLTAKSQVYAENARAEADEALSDLLTREALDYGLACSETAFVAVRKEAGRVVEGSVAVANALPGGWSDRFGQFGRGGHRIMLCRSLPSPPPSVPLFSNQSRRVTGSFDVSMSAAPPPAMDMFAADMVVGAQAPDAQAEDEARLPVPDRTVLFSGRPQGSGAIILFDSARDQAVHHLPEAGTINRLIISFPGGAPAADSLGAGLCLLLFVDDLATPRARARLADLARQGGARPLNLSRRPGQVLRLALIDPAGVWSAGAPHIEVALEWA
ncbi:MAG: VIT domain-containing protein [Blastocatellia bacterium]